MKMIGCTRCKTPALYCECSDMDDRLKKIVDIGGSEARLATYIRLARTITQGLGISKKSLAEEYIRQNPDDENAVNLYLKEHTIEGKMQALREQFIELGNEIRKAYEKMIEDIKKAWRGE